MELKRVALQDGAKPFLAQEICLVQESLRDCTHFALTALTPRRRLEVRLRLEIRRGVSPLFDKHVQSQRQRSGRYLNETRPHTIGPCSAAMRYLESSGTH